MAGISTGTGLASGIDYTTMISQLMQIEARPQTLLKTQLTNTKNDASAYRKLNTALASLSSAAQALTGTGMTSARKASSSSTAVTATAGATAVPGNSVTFTVTDLAAAQTAVTAGTWTSATGDVRTSSNSPSSLPSWPLSVVKGGKVVGTIKLPATATPTLNDAAAAINNSGLGLSATVVKLNTGFKLQITSATTGKDSAFKLLGPTETDPTVTGAGSRFTVTSDAKDAALDLGNSMTATSSSNTFSDLVTGVSLTVSAKDTTATTITVANDTSAVTAKVKAMMDAANTALSTIHDLTDSTEGSTAALKGNWALTNLASQIRSQVSKAVEVTKPAVGSTAATTVGMSPATAGISLKKDGTIVFDSAKFSSALAADPALAQKILGGSTGVGADNVNYTPDDPIVVDGIAARMSVLAEQASDSATGMITTLANSQDTRVKDLQKQIDAWDLRLTSRRASLTAQFNAMETALGSLHNQSTWLSSQIASLPSSSKA
jgi:flagellar hook-associated protein 2